MGGLAPCHKQDLPKIRNVSRLAESAKTNLNTEMTRLRKLHSARTSEHIALTSLYEQIAVRTRKGSDNGVKGHSKLGQTFKINGFWSRCWCWRQRNVICRSSRRGSVRLQQIIETKEKAMEWQLDDIMLSVQRLKVKALLIQDELISQDHFY